MLTKSCYLIDIYGFFFRSLIFQIIKCVNLSEISFIILNSRRAAHSAKMTAPMTTIETVTITRPLKVIILNFIKCNQKRKFDSIERSVCSVIGYKYHIYYMAPSVIRFIYRFSY